MPIEMLKFNVARVARANAIYLQSKQCRDVNVNALGFLLVSFSMGRSRQSFATATLCRPPIQATRSYCAWRF